MIKRILSTAFLPLAWTVMIQVLLCLPGSDIPSGGVFNIPHLDKMVHIVLFGTLTFLWCYMFYLKGKPASSLKTIFLVVYILAAGNGILLEFIQRDYIPNRSFDLADIIADMAGSSLAYGICNIKLLKTVL